MATWSDVERIALALPETKEGTSFGSRAWKVKDKTFVWERPLRKSDVAKLGRGAPSGAILGVRTEDLEMKDAMLATGEPAFFTIPHFDGYAAVLVVLAKISAKDLRAVIEDAWIARAPQKIADAFIARKRV